MGQYITTRIIYGYDLTALLGDAYDQDYENDGIEYIYDRERYIPFLGIEVRTIFNTIFDYNEISSTEVSDDTRNLLTDMEKTVTYEVAEYISDKEPKLFIIVSYG